MEFLSAEFWINIISQAPTFIGLVVLAAVLNQKLDRVMARYDLIVDFLLDKAFDEEETRDLKRLS